MKNNLSLVKRTASLGYAEICYATVVATNYDYAGIPSYVLQLLNNDEMIALKAESCLIVPEVNDLVLVTSTAVADQVFILQILNRVATANTLDLGQNTVIIGDKLKIAANAQIEIEAPHVSLSGIKGSASFSHSSFVSNWCEVKLHKAAMIIHSLDRIINTVTEKIVNSFRTIEGIEQTKAQRIRTVVTERMFLKAKHTTINAEEEVSVDGKKIHIG